MTKKKKPKVLKPKQFNKLILKTVSKAIDLAVEDTGLEEYNYGMLESRIEWYLNDLKKEIGYEILFKFDRDKCKILVTEVREYKAPVVEDSVVYVS